MGGLSLWHIIAFGVVAFLLFGSSFKISDVMGDVAKGIKSFKKGMSDDEPATPAAAADPLKTLDHAAQASADKAAAEARKAG